MARSGLKRVVKTVKGKKSRVRRAYWVKSAQPARKRAYKLAAKYAAVGLGAALLAGGAFYGLSKLENHQTEQLRRARNLHLSRMEADLQRDGAEARGLLQRVASPFRPNRAGGASGAPLTLSQLKGIATHFDVTLGSMHNRHVREGRAVGEGTATLHGPTPGTHIMGRGGQDIRGLHYAPNALRGGGAIFTDPRALAAHRSRSMRLAPTTAADATRAHHAANTPISLDSIGHGVLGSVTMNHAINNLSYTRQRGHVPYTSPAAQRRGMFLGMLR